MERRRVEYDNTGDAGQHYSMLRVRAFDGDNLELTVIAGDTCECQEGEIDIVLNRAQVEHLKDLLMQELARKDSAVIREIK